MNFINKIINNDSFGYAKTYMKSIKNSLNATLNAVLTKKTGSRRESVWSKRESGFTWLFRLPCGAKAVFSILMVYFTTTR